MSVALRYAAIFLLYLVLSALEDRSVEGLYCVSALATLQLCCVLLKIQADAQHLYFGRRAATRIRQILTASILDAVLKRASPLSESPREKRGSRLKRSKRDRRRSLDATGPSQPSPRAGGESVNQLTADSNRISTFVASVHILFGAPLEIIISGIFLYW